VVADGRVRHDRRVVTDRRTQYARAGDAYLAYQVVGDGPLDLVLVWGTMSHVELQWQDPLCAHFLDRLASFSRLILFDKRGCGLSDRVAGQPTLEQRMDDVRAVMDAAGSERAAIFGESEGGPMSLMFAATHPDRTQALVLYGAFARWVDEGMPGAWDPAAFRQLVDDHVARWGEGQVMRWFAPAYAGFGEDLLREMGGHFERSAFSPGGFRELMLLNAEIDVRAVCAQVQVPTLVLHRTGDQVVNVLQGRWLGENIPGANYVELDGEDHLPHVGDAESILRHTAEFLTGAHQPVETDRVLATVLFTDLVDSTRRAAEVGDARWRDVLDRHDALVRGTLDRYDGREVKSTGDGFLATFTGPARAVRCGLDVVRQGLRAGLAMRVGIHTGEIEVRGDDIGGIGVHIAARIGAMAAANEVLVSRTVKDLVAGAGLSFDDRGTHQLKGVPEPWQVLAALA
jgi:pimeloyl-ACP methyl ester carboxylesterase